MHQTALEGRQFIIHNYIFPFTEMPEAEPVTKKKKNQWELNLVTRHWICSLRFIWNFFCAEANHSINAQHFIKVSQLPTAQVISHWNYKRDWVRHQDGPSKAETVTMVDISSFLPRAKTRSCPVLRTIVQRRHAVECFRCSNWLIYEKKDEQWSAGALKA